MDKRVLVQLEIGLERERQFAEIVTVGEQFDSVEFGLPVEGEIGLELKRQLELLNLIFLEGRLLEDQVVGFLLILLLQVAME